MTPNLRRDPAPGRSPRRRVLVLLAWYATDVFRGIARYARDAGWVIDSNFERTRSVPWHWTGDGIVCVLGVDADVDAFVAQRRLPTVNIGYTNVRGVARVAAQQEAIGRMAADHFRQRGFRHFAYYMRSRQEGDVGRHRAFAAALGRKQPAHLLDATASGRRLADDGERLHWLGQELARLPRPLAVFAEIDDYAIEVIEAARMAGLRVPEDVAVLGVGNDELRCPFAAVPLSSIDDNPLGIGYQAAATLDRLMSGQRAPAHPQLVAPVGGVTRQSTDLLAVEHPLVVQALRLIREHYREPVTAEGMMAAVPMSRRRLHDAFLRHIGRSIADELLRIRLEHARRLLTDTTEKLSVVARESGLGSEARLNEVFQRKFHLTPGQYRLRHRGRLRVEG